GPRSVSTQAREPAKRLAFVGCPASSGRSAVMPMRGASGRPAIAGRQLDLEQSLVWVIDLEGRVLQPEALVQHRLHVAACEVAVALGCDEHVRREGGKAARDFPHVQIVYL